MSDSQRYEIRLAAEAIEHLKGIEKKHRRAILQSLEEQLSHEPLVKTRNRKPLGGSTLFGPESWELRLGPDNGFRVFYRAEAETLRVLIKAIGIKQGNRLFIAGEEVSL
jgi:mRNA-degrading endonuclease RelE of RelBE toxin-antitoxin system